MQSIVIGCMLACVSHIWALYLPCPYLSKDLMWSCICNWIFIFSNSPNLDLFPVADADDILLVCLLLLSTFSCESHYLPHQPHLASVLQTTFWRMFYTCSFGPPPRVSCVFSPHQSLYLHFPSQFPPLPTRLVSISCWQVDVAAQTGDYLWGPHLTCDSL